LAAAAQWWQCWRHYGGSSGGRRFLQLGAGGAAVAAWSWQQCNRARAVGAASAEEESSSCRQAVFYVVIVLIKHTLIFGYLFGLYRFLKYYSDVEYSPDQPHAKFLFFRLVGDFFLTDRTQFSDHTQKLTSQIEVEGRTTQTPSKKACGRRACGHKTGP
jgi:hypothetical protein